MPGLVFGQLWTGRNPEGISTSLRDPASQGGDRVNNLKGIAVGLGIPLTFGQTGRNPEGISKSPIAFGNVVDPASQGGD